MDPVLTYYIHTTTVYQYYYYILVIPLQNFLQTDDAHWVQAYTNIQVKYKYKYIVQVQAFNQSKGDIKSEH